MRLKYSGSLVFFTCLIISCGIVQAKDKVIFIQTEASITFTILENLAGSVASKLGSGIYIYKLSMPEFVSSVNKNFVTKNVEGVQKKNFLSVSLSPRLPECNLRGGQVCVFVADKNLIIKQIQNISHCRRHPSREKSLRFTPVCRNLN